MAIHITMITMATHITVVDIQTSTMQGTITTIITSRVEIDVHRIITMDLEVLV